jgi:hypothetical protein
MIIRRAIVADSERALRRMVVKLREMPPVHFDAVIDTLTPQQRARVVDLLQQLEGESVESQLRAEVRAPHEPLAVPPELSAWLVARINGNPTAGEEVSDVFEMTEHATRVLRECAAELAPRPKRSHGPSLFGIGFNRLIGREARQ